LGRFLPVTGEAVDRQHREAAGNLQQTEWYHGKFRLCSLRWTAEAFFIDKTQEFMFNFNVYPENKR
jgi:hypothetical protein